MSCQSEIVILFFLAKAQKTQRNKFIYALWASRATSIGYFKVDTSLILNTYYDLADLKVPGSTLMAGGCNDPVPPSYFSLQNNRSSHVGSIA